MSGEAAPAPRRPSGGGKLSFYFAAVFTLFFVVSFLLNIQHGGTAAPFNMMHGLRREEWSASSTTTSSSASKNSNEKPVPRHQLAGLNCDAYGGPSPEIAQDMVYWEDIPQDSAYVSPFKRKDQVQYMTFEPDAGGWNNIRMSMETVLTMAYAMGRVLVLPPDQSYYLLMKHHEKKKNTFSFEHFFHMESISREHSQGLKIITMKEFLETVAMEGKLVHRSTGKATFPPHNRTDWDGERKGLIKSQLNHWLRQVTHNTIWDPDTCMAAFPATTDAAGVERLKAFYKENKEGPGGFGTYEDYIGKPNPVNATPQVRMRENWASRKELCIYDLEMQAAPIVHFPMDHGIDGARLLVHFYAFLFFEDWKQDLWMKRFVRDHVRYVDELQCAAARIVHALKERAALRNSTSFDGFHVRRGDFQYKETRVEASVLYDVSKDQLTPGATVYIATDEHNKSFFDPLKEHYDVVFLDDFLHLVPDLNTNYYGMLDQLVASRSRIFFGCWFSTFTSYINRMRGYMATKLKAPGFEHGLVESYYYARNEDKMKMRVFYPVKQTYHSREYPAGWRGINEGIGLQSGTTDKVAQQ